MRTMVRKGAVADIFILIYYSSRVVINRSDTRHYIIIMLATIIESV